MNREEIRRKLGQALGRVMEEEVDIAGIRDDARLIEDLGVDSYSITGLIYEIEDAFDFLISDEEFAELRTVSDVLDLVQRKLEGAGGAA